MKVLIVDDDFDYASVLASSLRVRGHETEVRTSAFGICNRVSGRDRLGRPDVVILDYQLPGLSGEGALQILAKDPEALRVPVILHSAIDAELLDHAIRHHPLAVSVTKDGRVKALIDTVLFLARSLSAKATAMA